MKKIILASTAILLSFASFAQTDSINNMMNHDMNNNKMGSGMNHQEMDKSHGNGVMMMNGKMMMQHSGKMTIMNHDTTMTNGTQVMTNGTCINRDGTKFMMKEGECMEMSGKMGDCAMMNKVGKMDMAGTYYCPMHHEITSGKAGKCPKCGMNLEMKQVK